MVAIHSCPECGNKEGYSLASEGHNTLAECSKCSHLCDAESDEEPDFEWMADVANGR